MIRATISQVKNSLSAYLRRVRAGETVLIMDRKTPVASLTPVPARGAVDPRLQRLIDTGVIVRPSAATGAPAKAEPVDRPKPPPRVETDVDVLGILLAERRSGR